MNDSHNVSFISSISLVFLLSLSTNIQHSFKIISKIHLATFFYLGLREIFEKKMLEGRNKYENKRKNTSDSVK